ncbi:maleylpyruvate isomerase family mycothiol-dependent enzyme [Saccharopolyspora sp. K220]|uniref:maleylpyruvate isomerase family mycothiol-dependent enzyme n=1 Tax=Saccharopolyspora soli TaxID=2926618 RepID=UPI001F56905C|nr:maleylpyruvate isomerase family mycothiol-dependent enzyme [Saccharopolyspora soli]MCI2416967.1 maleylpyruvate isomerase family mycothiol-dependent enzyme [Saccharopolyspora soli]
MASEFHHHAFRDQAAAFRSAVIQAGPDAEVSTCPGWDVRRLVQHLARVYANVALALELEPGDERPRPPRPPADFDDALTWWDDRFTHLVHALSTSDPARPVWSFFPGGTAERWTRRMAHETAIHRLDAEHALACLGPDHVHELIFDPALAADGIDEMLTVILPVTVNWAEREHEGKVLYHAPDAGRAWLVEYQPGWPPVAGAPTDAALEVDATVAGTADAVYRRVWGRPSTALITGNTALVNLVSGR